MEEETCTIELRHPRTQDSKNNVQGKTPETKRYSEILRDFDQLELSFCSPMDELLPDSDTYSISEAISTEIAETTDLEDMTSEDVDVSDIRQDGEEKDETLSAQDADMALCRCEGGVEMALQYAKMWCRYAKDLLAWMDKRIGLEQEFAKNIIKAAETAKTCVVQQDMMPLQYIYTMVLEHDVKTSTVTKHTGELVLQRCYQALSAKRNEIDKWRREFKEQWAKEQKRMNDAEAALKKARQQYIQRCEELEKAKAVTAKAQEETAGYKTLDKRRKSRDDAQTKVTEAEALYRQCAHDANIHQDELLKVKERIIVHIRKLICQGDNVLKEATVNMFFYQRQQTEPIPLSYQSLEMTCRPYEPGEPYLLYIKKQRRREKPPKTYIFQEFIPQGRRSPSTGRRKASNPITAIQDSYPLPDDLRRGSNIDGKRIGYSDSESMGGSLESLSSPAHSMRKLPKAPSTGTMSSDDLDDKDMGVINEAESIEADSNGTANKIRAASRAAMTHRLRKLKSKMVKCRQCDNFILVNGIECEECSLALHRKCLEVCQLECESRKGFLFGIDFPLLTRDQPDEVPFIVQLCTAEIENRALTVQGVYRVSGSKPRILRLCQAFEIQKDQVELSDLSPHDITSVLKHFFKELPEPLFTFDLYTDFIGVGKDIQRLSEKEHAADTPGIVENIVVKLRELMERLPRCNYVALRHMISHLHRVAEHYEENKMSPGNLGIVFGPTFLRPLVSGDMSMLALLETSYQALLVEFMISHQEQVFGLPPRASTPPPPAPTAPLPETPPRVSSSPTQTSASQGLDVSSRERPRSLETRTIKRDSSEGYISDKSSSNEAVDQLSPEANERAVLALKGASAAALGHSVGESDSHVGARSHFSRQPVKYQRQPPSAADLHTAGSQPGESESTGAGETVQTVSADSSRSCSPERENPAQASLDTKRETSFLHSKAGHALKAQTRSCDSARATGLDDVVRASGAAASNPKTSRTLVPETKEKVDQLAKLNSNQSNNRHRVSEGQAGPRSYRRQPREQRSAHKILSGLKLKRSDSGKGEQLHFV
ncbi:GEM-interacting protein [Chanos chanos]|uniref:GEM-interacting protein n=1 Tax=Chanos chanos TaxID=29144 RepID=A0A6J2WM66_CHACN|nr:GEM-interacting protein [Chanos chanos]